jgi:hypothetical protein
MLKYNPQLLLAPPWRPKIVPVDRHEDFPPAYLSPDITAFNVEPCGYVHDNGEKSS